MTSIITLRGALIAALAAFAMALAGSIGASAETGGHFESEVAHTEIKGEDDPTDPTQRTGVTTVECEETTYEGTTTEASVEEITITPTYGSCKELVFGTTIVITMNECDYVFTVGPEPESADNTMHIVCPEESPGIETHLGTGCTITTAPNQTPAGGLTYTTGVSNEKHDLTVDFTLAGIHTVYHGGFFACGVANGHTTDSSIHGTATLEGFDTDGNPVDITATG